MSRISNFLEALERERLDAFLVTSQVDIRYLVGFSGSAGMLWVSPERVVFLTDFRYETQSKEQIGDKAEIHIITAEKGYYDWIEELKLTEGKKFVGFDENVVKYGTYKRLISRFPDVNWIPLADPIGKLRAVKDPDEVNKIQQAVDIAVEALSETLPLLRPGITEKEFAAELEYRMRRKGSERPAFETIVASGYRAALPHGIASDKVISAGEMVTIDFGAVFEGYASDLTRTYFVGTPDQKFKEIYGIVLRAQTTAIQNAKPGITGKELDGIARKIIEDAGYGEYFGHSLGHGLGLYVHDSVAVGVRNENPLEEGTVITIEPGIYIPEWGGVRIEDDAVLRADGAEVLSEQLPKQLGDIVIPVD